MTTPARILWRRKYGPDRWKARAKCGNVARYGYGPTARIARINAEYAAERAAQKSV